MPIPLLLLLSTNGVTSTFQADSNSWCVLELQSLREEEGRAYRVVRCWTDDVGAEVWPFLPFHPRVAMSTGSLS